MDDLIAFLFIVWLFGGALWGIIATAEWLTSREFRSNHTDAEMRQKAVRVLQTPIWPLPALGMLGRAIGNLTHDVMRGND